MGGLGSFLGPLLAVLGRSWDLCGWSWAALGTSVGGLGPLLGPQWVVLGQDQAGKWPKPERGHDLGREGGREGDRPASAATLATLRDQYLFFSIDIHGTIH